MRCIEIFFHGADTLLVLQDSTLKPWGDRVLVKINAADDKIAGRILLPTTIKTSPEGRTVGRKRVEIDMKLQTGTPVVYSKYDGTEVEFNGTRHLLLKEDDIDAILETDHVKELKFFNDKVLIKNGLGLRDMS